MVYRALTSTCINAGKLFQAKDALAMTTARTTFFVSVSGLTLAFSALSASAQSLPVPMPEEERIELRTAKTRADYEGGPTQYATARIPSPVTGAPLSDRLSRPAPQTSTQQTIRKQAAQIPAEDVLRALPPGATGYMIKAGSFRTFENAERLQAQLFSIGTAKIVPRRANGKDFYGVYLGPWATEAEAFTAYGLAMDAGMQDGEIIDPPAY